MNPKIYLQISTISAVFNFLPTVLLWFIYCYGTVIYPFMDSSKIYINREPSILVEIG